MEITFMREKKVKFGELKIGDGFIDGDGDFGIKVDEGTQMYVLRNPNSVGSQSMRDDIKVTKCDYEIIVK